MNHFPTCRRCGNAGPPVRYVTSKGKTKLVCAWCLDLIRRRVAKRLAGASED